MNDGQQSSIGIIASWMRNCVLVDCWVDVCMNFFDNIHRGLDSKIHDHSFDTLTTSCDLRDTLLVYYAA